MSARASQLYLSETRLMSRTERLRPSKSSSTERRTSNTTISLPNLTINSRSHSSGYSENLQSKYNFLTRQCFRSPQIYFSDDFQQYSNFSFQSFSEAALSLVEAPVLAPQEVAIDEAQVQQMQNELNEAAGQELPDDEDDF